MKKILVTGAGGQIGSELTERLRKEYGENNVIASDVKEGMHQDHGHGLFEFCDITNPKNIGVVADKHKVDTIVHLAAILSATGEKNPNKLWEINTNGLHNCLEVAREKNLMVFTPSSIAAFGPTAPKDNTPQDTIQRPTTIYGISKVAGELLCDYYYHRYGVDTRGVRFPGLISYKALPGGGTTDYAVHIYYEAIKQGRFECELKADTYMDMMYMPDALDSIIMLAEADPSKLIHRNAFNIAAMSFCPEDIAASIKKHIPEFEITYNIDEVKQEIANSWPNSIDDTAAREEWGWKPKYDLDMMTKDMLEKLHIKLKK